MRYRNRDPHWIVTRFPTPQSDGSIAPVGTRAFYYPANKTLLFGQQAQDAASKFDAERQDEEAYGAGYGV